MTDSIATLLLDRLFEAQGKRALEEALKQAKAERNLERNSFRTSGTAEELRSIVAKALSEGHFTISELQSLVDEAEENGGQHIFLFNLQPSAAKAVSSLVEALPAAPKSPSEALYALEPRQDRVFVCSQKSDSVLRIKQVRCAHYWAIDEAESSESEERQVVVRVRKTKRAVNVINCDLGSNVIEVRISRVSNEANSQDAMAYELFTELATRLEPHFNFQRDATVTPVWQGFSSIVQDREGTHMSTDAAADATFKKSISSRREARSGKDVRDSTGYELDNKKYSRDSLSVYWKIPGGDERWVHSYIARFRPRAVAEPTDIGKVFITAKATAEEIAYVIRRIRKSAE